MSIEGFQGGDRFGEPPSPGFISPLQDRMGREAPKQGVVIDTLSVRCPKRSIKLSIEIYPSGRMGSVRLISHHLREGRRLSNLGIASPAKFRSVSLDHFMDEYGDDFMEENLLIPIFEEMSPHYAARKGKSKVNLRDLEIGFG